MNNNPLFMLK